MGDKLQKINRREFTQKNPNTFEVRTNRAYSIVLGLRERTLPPLGGVLVLRVVDLFRPAALDVELAATLDRNPTAPLCLGCE